MISLMWELIESPSQVIGFYCGFVDMALLNGRVDVLNEVLENVSPVAESIGNNGWIEASILKRIIEQGLAQLENKNT